MNYAEKDKELNVHCPGLYPVIVQCINNVYVHYNLQCYLYMYIIIHQCRQIKSKRQSNQNFKTETGLSKDMKDGRVTKI